MTATRGHKWGLKGFARDKRGVAAIDFALLGLPFLLLLICVMQLGLYYMTQVALDSGTVQAAESLRSVFSTGATPVTPTGAALKSSIVANSGSWRCSLLPIWVAGPWPSRTD